MHDLRPYRTYLWSLALGLLGAACSFDPSGGLGGSGTAIDGGPMIVPDGAPPPDGPIAVIDGAPGTPDAGCQDLLPFTPSNFDPCQLAPLNAPIVLDVKSGIFQIDTDAATLDRPGSDPEPLSSIVIEQDGAPPLLVIATSSFVIGPESALGVVGTRVVAIVSTGDLTVLGGISAGAVGAGSGPGGDDADSCATGRGAGGEVQEIGVLEGGSGGGGGGFSAAGGDGAAVDGADEPDLSPGGQAVGNEELVPLRGGCGGGSGGFAGGGPGGGAGGGLQLVAGGELRIDGIVTARGGGGGSVAGSLSGGGGGGAGGGLLLEASSIAIDGALTANGGGGGEGSRTGVASDPGNNGPDDAAQRAPGGSGISNGGDGGPGGARDAEAGAIGLEGNSIVSALAGGGGGGGSTGRIHLRSIDGAPTFGPGAVVSPAPR